MSIQTIDTGSVIVRIERRDHNERNHFDFYSPARRIVVSGPMGSGKTEYAARIWRDSEVARRKTGKIKIYNKDGQSDRRKVFIIRSRMGTRQFGQCPADSLSYRGGSVQCGKNIADADNSFEVEQIIDKHPDIGTWILDEASFYDERLAYIVFKLSQKRELIFVFPMLLWNFRREYFKSTANLLLEHATDHIPLTAYCEHRSCLRDARHSYRFYMIDGKECPALYFDPLIIVGGDDRQLGDPIDPNYSARCIEHHILPAKEYTYMVLKPLGIAAAGGDEEGLKKELGLMRDDIKKSRLGVDLAKCSFGSTERGSLFLNALLVPYIAERAMLYLYSEENLISHDQCVKLISEIGLSREYLAKRSKENGRPIIF